MTELATKTSKADTRMGTQRLKVDTMCALLGLVVRDLESPGPSPSYPRRRTIVATEPAAPNRTSDTPTSTRTAFIVVVFIVPRLMNPK